MNTELHLYIPEIAGIGDPSERRFGEIALSQGYILVDPGVISLDRPKTGKQDKRTTVCDFLIKATADDPGYLVEVTRKNLCSRKQRQLNVIIEAGLLGRYAQITDQDLDRIVEMNLDIYSYVAEKAVDLKTKAIFLLID